MSQEKNNREQLLIGLATRLQHDSDLGQELHEFHESHANLVLSEAELQELARIRDAIVFLKSVCESNNPDAGSSQASSVKLTTSETLPIGDEKEHVGENGRLPPTSISRFKIKEIIGRGGFSEVYRAHDPTLNRDVALKVLKTSAYFTVDAVVRFQREAQAAGILNHPNIVPVFETGETDGQRFIVSELCEGITLKSWFEKHQRKVASRISATIVATLAEAVDHAHQRGVIHRDLKPANIMIEPDFDSANAKQSSSFKGPRITDFGLAKHAAKTDLMETIEGAIVGTPAYMSPEQAKGETNIENDSDIYSLGVILYELLTGRVPILGATNIDTLLAINKSEIAAPRKIVPSVPRDLESICLKCLQKSPSGRYASALDLSADLNRWLNGDVIQARRVTNVERASKWCARNPVVASLFALTIVALMFSLWQWRQSNANSKFAAKQSKIAESESDRAEIHLQSVTEFVDQFLLDVERLGDPSLVSTSQRARVDEILVLQRSLIDEEKSNAAVRTNTLRALYQISKISMALGQLEQAVKISTEARNWLGDPVEWRDSADGMDKQFVSDVLDLGLNEVRSLNEMSRGQQAVDTATWISNVFGEYQDLFDPLEQRRFEVVLGMYRGLAYGANNENANATVEFQRAADAGEELLVLDSPPGLDSVLPVVSNLINLGNRMRYDGDSETALHWLQRANEIANEFEETQDESVTSDIPFLRSKSLAQSSLVSSLQALHRSKEAEIASLEALVSLRRLVEKVPQNNHYLIALAKGLSRHADLLTRRKHFQAGLDTIDQIEKLKEKGLAQTLNGKATILHALIQKTRTLISSNTPNTDDDKLKAAELNAAYTVELANEYFGDEPDHVIGLNATGSSWVVLLEVKTRLNLSKELLELIPEGCRVLERAENLSVGTAYKKRWRTQRIFYRGQKSRHLARSHQWQEAVEAVGEVLKLDSLKGPKPAPPYFEAANYMSVVLDIWAKAVESPGPEYEAAREQAMDWLELVITKIGTREGERLLNHSNFKRLREHERFEEIHALINKTIPEK